MGGLETLCITSVSVLSWNCFFFLVSIVAIVVESGHLWLTVVILALHCNFVSGAKVPSNPAEWSGELCSQNGCWVSPAEGATGVSHQQLRHDAGCTDGVCVCVCMCVSVCKCARTCTLTHTNTRAHLHTHAHLHTLTHVLVCMCVSVPVC